MTPGPMSESARLALVLAAECRVAGNYDGSAQSENDCINSIKLLMSEGSPRLRSALADAVSQYEGLAQSEIDCVDSIKLLMREGSPRLRCALADAVSQKASAATSA